MRGMVAMAEKWLELWNRLNPRQKHFLETIYIEECIRADYYARQLDAGPIYRIIRASDAWTWMVHKAGASGLHKRLGYQDAGVGSTYKSLADRGFLERRYDGGLPTAARMLYVRLTRRGRRLVREQVGQRHRMPPLPHYPRAPGMLESSLARNMQAAGETAARDAHELSGWRLVGAPGPLRYRADCRRCGEVFVVRPQRIEEQSTMACHGLGPEID